MIRKSSFIDVLFLFTREDNTLGLLHLLFHVSPFLLNIHYICREKSNMNLIELNIDQIIALCKKYKVNKLFVFGSILTDRFNKESDVDFIVNFDKAQVTDYFSNFFDLKYALEDILGREVDLLEEHAIRNHYLKENIEQTKALIYG